MEQAVIITLTGGNVTSVEIRISGGGVTYGYAHGRAWILVLPAGHLGSAIIGASLVFAGFSVLAVSALMKLPMQIMKIILLQSKIASLAVAAIMIASLAWLVKDRVSVPATFFAVISESYHI